MHELIQSLSQALSEALTLLDQNYAEARPNSRFEHLHLVNDAARLFLALNDSPTTTTPRESPLDYRKLYLGIAADPEGAAVYVVADDIQTTMRILTEAWRKRAHDYQPEIESFEQLRKLCGATIVQIQVIKQLDQNERTTH